MQHTEGEPPPPSATANRVLGRPCRWRAAPSRPASRLPTDRLGGSQPLQFCPALHNRSFVGTRQSVALASHLADRPLWDVHLDGQGSLPATLRFDLHGPDRDLAADAILLVGRHAMPHRLALKE